MAELESQSQNDMAESPTRPGSANRLQPIFNSLISAGYAHAHEPGVSDADEVVKALAWCISAVDPSVGCFEIGILTQQQNKIEFGKQIEESLKSMKCPYALEASQIQNLDVESIFPAVQWLLDRLRSSSRADTEYEERKSEVMNQLQQLRGRIEEGTETEVLHNLVALMRSLKDLEKQESDFQSYSNAKHTQLQAEIIELEEKIANGCDSKSLMDSLDCSLSKSAEEVNSARKELASILRADLAAKRQLDDLPSQSELIQYERRFSELYVHIQGKHQQTQKHYDTYNALLEIKELMLKEISLLNSISSQFQDAIISTAGRMNLIDSMERIVKSSQQKQEKVQIVLEDEHKICAALKEKYAAAIAEQRHLYSLLKVFQEECAKNERLKSQSAV